MSKSIVLSVNSYEKALKQILKDYERFCEENELVEVDLQLERIGDTINVTWVIPFDELQTIQQVYHDYLVFTSDCKEEVELTEVNLEDGEYNVLYRIKRTYTYDQTIK